MIGGRYGSGYQQPPGGVAMRREFDLQFLPWDASKTLPDGLRADGEMPDEPSPELVEFTQHVGEALADGSILVGVLPLAQPGQAVLLAARPVDRG